MPRLHAGVFGVEMGGKKVTNLVIMGAMAFALILAIQGILGVVERFKGDDQANQGVPSTVVPLLPAIDQELPQGLTSEDIEKIGSVFGDGSSPGVLDNPGGGLGGEDLKRILEEAEFLACAAEGRNWDVATATCN
jgi:hypothetical protein